MVYLKLIAISIRSQIQDRASFLMLALAHFIGTASDIIAIWILFDRFKTIQGWTLAQLAIGYGVIHMGFAIAESTARGFDTFGQVLKKGDFDRILLRPVSTVVQVASSSFQIMRIGRFLQGLLVLLFGATTLGLSPFAIGVVCLSILGSAALFYGLFVFQATLSFWSTESLELMNIATYGGVETASYPMSIYKPLFRLFFSTLIPLATVSYYPIAILLQHEEFPLYAALLFPLAGFLFLLLSLQAWKFGVRHYQSTGN